jgi:hypothetical protein
MAILASASLTTNTTGSNHPLLHRSRGTRMSDGPILIRESHSPPVCTQCLLTHVKYPRYTLGVFIVDVANISSKLGNKDETHKKCANLLTASLVTGAHSKEDLIRRDDRVREKWGMGSEEKARALLNVWAGSTLLVKRLRDHISVYNLENANI